MRRRLMNSALFAGFGEGAVVLFIWNSSASGYVFVMVRLYSALQINVER